VATCSEKEEVVHEQQLQQAGAKAGGVKPKPAGWGNPISFAEGVERFRRALEGTPYADRPVPPSAALKLGGCCSSGSGAVEDALYTSPSLNSTRPSVCLSALTLN
jgi:hypothetical protein